MSPRPPSRAVNAGYALATIMFFFVAAFTLFEIVSLLFAVARGGETLLWGKTLTVPASLNPDTLRLPHGVTASGWPHVQLQVKDPTTRQSVLRSLVDLGPSLLFVALFALLRAIARSVKDGDPFGAANVGRLRRIGMLLVLGFPLVELLNTSLRESLFNALPPDRFGDIGVAGFTLPGNALVAGLGAFILAEVFAYGLTLREDVEGTV